jgi:TRAP-type C4-dicarboxylate transport system permease small subunit
VKRFLQRVLDWLHRLEDLLLVSMLVMMMLASVVQILVRNLSDGGIVWADPMVRVLVLWAGLLGAMVATRQNNHITIDVLTRYLPARVKALAGFLSMAATSLLCGGAAWYAFRFVRMEFEFRTPAFAGIPTWACQTIIPAAFAVISIRCLVAAAGHLLSMAAPRP